MMLCRDCPWNDFKRNGNFLCVLPRCLYKERGEKQDGKATEIQNCSRVAKRD